MGVLDSIGNTPLVSLERIFHKPGVTIKAKLEGSNPGGSVKDRIAFVMIRDAEAAGKIKKGDTILEATSGNTGIGLAMVGAAKGYRVKLVMPSCVSQERRKVLEAFGAELVLSPGNEGTDGAIRLAHRILQDAPEQYFMPNQFENPSNYMAHYETTGEEIIEQTGGDLDCFVAGMGTTGTLMGVSRRLKEHRSSIRIIGIEPNLGHKIQGLKNMKEAIVPTIYDPSHLDEIMTIGDEEAFATARRLALEEGIFVGMSSGAAMAGAMKVAEGMEKGTVVVLFPDRGDRYLSTTLFASICGCCPP
ncbi:MAG: cysteine synthase family protein [Nitrospirales bacterium]|nr:cysteine synthase family protein [Nitrospirales bacterium]